MDSKNENNDVYLSIVAPAYNEAENLPQLVAECVEAGSELGKDFEIILANDCSTDDTSAAGSHHPRCRCLTDRPDWHSQRTSANRSLALDHCECKNGGRPPAVPAPSDRIEITRSRRHEAPFASRSRDLGLTRRLSRRDHVISRREGSPATAEARPPVGDRASGRACARVRQERG